MKNTMVPRRRKKGTPGFKPDSKFIAEAVEEYLKKGGEIEKVKLNKKDFQNFVKGNDVRDTDDFLNGN